MTPASTAAAPTVAEAYRRNRARSRALFELLSEETYYSRPIDLRHPIVFYEGHLPAFSFNTLVKRALGGPVIDPHLERLFARGIDPPSPKNGYGVTSPSEVAQSSARAADAWPDRAVVRAFADEADRRVLDALMNIDLDRPGHALLDRAEAAHAILEHEAMHQETLLYMWHRLPHHQKQRPSGYVPRTAGAPPSAEWIRIPSGIATLGVDRASLAFGWDNEFPAHRVGVDAFAIEEHDVTNARFLEFVEAGGTRPAFWERRDGEWYWRGMFEWIPLPLAWPVYVSHAEACAFARWRGARLPTEAEFQRAAFGTPNGEERRHPWGDDDPRPHHGVFDFSAWDPEPAGSRSMGTSAFGVHDLVGNGWEWTSTTFAPFPGFRPMSSYPEYSADFFDGRHYVMKGASPATAMELLRPSFRNWFRPHYPYVYATFRLATDAV
ncbi:MAG: SUMF1/EgtB/PvdO family nonheme iron enzyme [Vicinamibacterales bacterium]